MWSVWEGVDVTLALTYYLSNVHARTHTHTHTHTTGPAVSFSDSVQSLRLPPPLLGQHTQEVLNEVCEYSLEEIQDMTKDGVLQTP